MGGEKQNKTKRFFYLPLYKYGLKPDRTIMLSFNFCCENTRVAHFTPTVYTVPITAYRTSQVFAVQISRSLLNCICLLSCVGSRSHHLHRHNIFGVARCSAFSIFTGKKFSGVLVVDLFFKDYTHCFMLKCLSLLRFFFNLDS